MGGDAHTQCQTAGHLVPSLFVGPRLIAPAFFARLGLVLVIRGGSDGGGFEAIGFFKVKE